uniref:Putative secreted protein n=1 Tax=Rhipicephalus microplus TaxID=6941 RepID=A0A6G5A2W3_RHIMP
MFASLRNILELRVSLFRLGGLAELHLLAWYVRAENNAAIRTCTCRSRPVHSWRRSLTSDFVKTPPCLLTARLKRFASFYNDHNSHSLIALLSFRVPENCRGNVARVAWCWNCVT